MMHLSCSRFQYNISISFPPKKKFQIKFVAIEYFPPLWMGCTYYCHSKLRPVWFPVLNPLLIRSLNDKLIFPHFPNQGNNSDIHLKWKIHLCKMQKGTRMMNVLHWFQWSSYSTFSTRQKGKIKSVFYRLGQYTWTKQIGFKPLFLFQIAYPRKVPPILSWPILHSTVYTQ